MSELPAFEDFYLAHPEKFDHCAGRLIDLTIANESALDEGWGTTVRCGDFQGNSAIVDKLARWAIPDEAACAYLDDTGCRMCLRRCRCRRR